MRNDNEIWQHEDAALVEKGMDEFAISSPRQSDVFMHR